MPLTAAIFDMDGLMINSEPLWNEAAAEVFSGYHIELSPQQYAASTGLRTKEFIEWWFRHFRIPIVYAPEACYKVIALTRQKMLQRLEPMPGVKYIFNFFKESGLQVGIASSSPREFIEIAIQLCNVGDETDAYESAHTLPLAKPHPQVYLNAAQALNADPLNCICFEDSFSGMIAVKAARMKCVVVPHPADAKKEHWAVADLKISSLQNFGKLHFDLMNHP